MKRNTVNCKEAQRLLHAYIDAELDVENSLEVEQHLRTCRCCSRDHHNYLMLRTAIREGSLFFSLPELLEKRIRSLTGKQTRGISRLASWRGLSVAAVLLLALFGIWGLAQWSISSSSQNTLVQEVLSSHVRSLMANQLVDVTSSDQQTIKPWFTSKLDFSPPVINLTSQGFSLLGGRLDYLNGRSVAAIVYKRGNHVINLFIWPSTQKGESEPSTTTIQGYYLTHWTAYGMNCWAVSDLASEEMRQFAQLFERQTVAWGNGLAPRHDVLSSLDHSTEQSQQSIVVSAVVHFGRPR
jgi:anti-sigma factor RsiW